MITQSNPAPVSEEIATNQPDQSINPAVTPAVPEGWVNNWRQDEPDWMRIAQVAASS